jgi:choline-sulfatase
MSVAGLAVRSAVLCAFVVIGLGACSRPAAPAAAARRSVIVITIDTLRADHVTPAATPVLDRLAKEAVVFESAITVSPLTLPAHASLLTGTFPPAHGVRDNQLFSLAESAPTYTRWFKECGYATAAFVGAIVLDERYGLAQGFDHYDDAMPEGAAERSSRDTLSRAEGWLTGTLSANGTPFFLWIHLFEPHAPYVTGSYAGEVAEVDRELETFFNALRRLGHWDDVVLTVTSDHGESLGEHAESTHGLFVYDSTLRIPWILKSQGLAPRRFSPQVRIVDVLPTMIALAEVGGGGPAFRGDGVDLLPHIRNGDSPKLEAYAETWLPRHQFNWSELKTIRSDRMKYIDAPEPELYAVATDPGEARNIIQGQQQVASAMRSTLAAIERHGRTAATRTPTDSTLADRFMALGYIGYSPEDASADGKWLADPKRKVDVYELTMKAFELAGQNRPDAALEVLGRVQAKDSGITQTYYLKGTVLGTQERYTEAAAALERAVELNPRYVPARFKLALAYLRLGQPDRAERALRVVLEHEPANARAIHNLAAIAYSQGDLARAEQLERKALAIDSGYFEAWNTLGAIYVVTDRPADAVASLNKAITLNPSSGQAHYNLALALRSNGQPDAALAAQQKACSLDQRYCR